MAKKEWRPGNMLYPLPAVLVTTRNKEKQDNICTVAWTGTICSDPAMLSISLRKSRLSYEYVRETGVFVVNLTTEALAHATDFCGVRSGRDIDKFEVEHLNKEEASHISCAMVAESPVNIECRVTEAKDLGSHTMFLAEVLAVHVDDRYMDEHGRFDLSLARPIVYSHGEYLAMGKKLGTFGYSVRKKRKGRGRA
ncbi:MAG: flavin reductase family protein [Eubacteriales bacterium]|jgi:flavin reductase (DIM6/NTAB) family NADH-FMN oxidoreductase RutF